MEGLSTLFQNFAELFNPLIEFLRWAFPLKIYRLHDGEAGVVLTLGKIRRKNAEKGPGITICWAFEELLNTQAIGGTIDLIEQIIQTADDRLMIMNGSLVYNITSMRKAMVEIEDIQDLVTGVCQNGMREYSILHTFEDISTSEKTTHDLAVRINRKLRKYGAEVTDIMIADLRQHETTMLCDAYKDLKLALTIN